MSGKTLWLIPERIAAILSILALAGSMTGVGSAAPLNSVKANAILVVRVTGSSQVTVGKTAQYAASVTNTTNQTVTWEVNGIAGGTTAIGTITKAGLYTAPAARPGSGSVTIMAVSAASSSSVGSLAVGILNTAPVLTSATAQLSLGSKYAVDVRGTGFLTGATILVGSTALTTTYVSATELKGTYTASSSQSGSVSIAAKNSNSGTSVSSSLSTPLWIISPTQAARFLDQASFGPTSASISHVAQVGLSAYLKEQFAATPTTLAAITKPYPTQCSSSSAACAQSEWWQAILTGDDQLRQRVAFALSEFLVTSVNTVKGEAEVAYMNLLIKDAFANYRTLLNDITLSPTMGAYLNMVNSGKAPTGQIANENYARELMQLFSVGLYELNADGTRKLDSSGNAIPAYTEAQLEDLARALTGWTYPNTDGTAPSKFQNATGAWSYQMQPLSGYHDHYSKTILNNVVLPASQTPEQDLKQALDAVFADSNVGPFVCKQLIQHLVTSAPSAAYVKRVTAVFADDGTGVRGNMKAVVRAILMDTEARAGDTDAEYNGGHLREPILYMTGIIRALGITSTDSAPGAHYAYQTLTPYARALLQSPLASTTVFNFFPIDNVIPGTTLLAPEFGIENTATVVLRNKLADQLINNKVTGFNLDLSTTSPLMKLAATSGDLLVDQLNGLLLHGQMSSDMRSIVLSQVNAFGSSYPGHRTRAALYLILTSPEYKIIH